MVTAAPKASQRLSVLITLSLFILICSSWWYQMPAADSEFTIGQTPFSLVNAKNHVALIAQRPHFTGSEDHERVRQYIVSELQKMGLEVEIQSTLATSSKYYVATRVNNIVARLRAPQWPPAQQGVILVSHYDSANYSALGASDAASGVAVILEGIRTFIDSQVAFTNDIYVLISDAEEQGLLGAEAFIAEHPWAKNVQVAVNFEARGSGGPSYTLLETNGGNLGLVEAFKQAKISYPTANSLMYSIYKMLPNDTDLTVFREQGNIKGFNFAFIDDHFDYHTQQDSPERLDDSSLNHQADYLTSLLPYLASADLQQLDSEVDHVYFNFANLGVYNYPFTWVLPMAVLLAFALVANAVSGVRRGTLSVKLMSIAVLPMVMTLALAVAVGWLGWQLLLWIYPQLGDIPQGFHYAGHLVIAFGILLTMSVSAGLYRWVTKKFPHITPANWYAPVVLLWVLVNLAIALGLTGAGFFIIMAVTTFAIFSNLQRAKQSVNRQALLITLFSIPGLVIVTPQIPVFVIGLGLSSLYIATTLSVMVWLTLMPLMFLIRGVRSIQLFLLGGAVIAAIGISMHSEYTTEQKKPTHLNYLYDHSTQQAWLYSYTRELDSFLGAVFEPADYKSIDISQVYPVSPRRMPIYTKVTAPLALDVPQYRAEVQEQGDGSTVLRLQITPNRSIQRLELSSDKGFLLHSLSVNGKTFAAKNKMQRPGFFFRMAMTDQQSVELLLHYDGKQKPQFRIVESAWDLPQRWEGFPNRDDTLMPSPFRISDMTQVSQRVILD